MILAVAVAKSKFKFKLHGQIQVSTPHPAKLMIAPLRERKSRLSWPSVYLSAFCVFVNAFFTSVHAENATIEFNRDIRPILSDNCFSCHGPDEHGRAADLRLDVREDAIDFGAIDVDAPEASLILERVSETDPEWVMPPPETGKSISPEQRSLLRQWIEQGAAYEEHWSFTEVSDEAAPSAPEAWDGWQHSSIDGWVAKGLLAAGRQPAPEAEKHQWLRRVTFDLTGLPPTLEELDAFEADQSKSAYEKVVERLLDSQGFGERMVNMWLDVARYADTFG